MRHWATPMRILCVVLAFGLAAGCEKNREPEDATPYDPEVDAPPTNLPVNPNPNLLADQAKLARPGADGAGAAGSSGSSGTPEAPSGQDPAAAAVRDAMGQIIHAAETGQWAGLTSYVTQGDQESVGTAGAALAKLDEVGKALEKAVKERIEGNPPAMLTQILERGAEGGPFFVRLGNMTADTLEVGMVDDETGTVKDSAGLNLTFKKFDDKWLLSLTQPQRDTLKALADLAGVQAETAEDLAAEFSSGTISQNNADAAIMQKAQPVIDARNQLKIVMSGEGGGT